MFKIRPPVRVVVVVALLVFAGNLTAEQLTTIAAFDMDKVLLGFYQDSATIREYRTAEEQFIQVYTSAKADLRNFRSRRATAVDRGDTTLARRLADDIAAQEEYLFDLEERWYQQEEDLLAELQGDAFIERLYEVVQYVAEDNGYTMVVDVSHAGSDVFWYSPAIDITEDVIQELLTRFR